jgi:molybdopterin/thiamine biosynthesis adenylyltransferase
MGTRWPYSRPWEEDEVQNLKGFLLARAENGIISFSVQAEAVREFRVPFPIVEETILKLDLLPARYLRNQGTLSRADQFSLFKSRVAVIGCGGLGGYIIEALARIGIGHITAIDPDVFDDHNLNRQLYSETATLGLSKAEVAFSRVRRINPAVAVTPVKGFFTREKGEKLLKGARVAVDALDSIEVRLELADVCRETGIPLVHGSIGGWYGQVTAQFPGDETLRKIYSRQTHDKGIEEKWGNLSFVAPLVAGLQAAEVVKIILDQGNTLRGKMLFINLLDGEIVHLAL